MAKLSDREILIRKAEAAIILRKREARSDFWAYCLYMDSSFFAKRHFLKKVAAAFMRVYLAFSNNMIYRLAVSMPPRAGKSYISSLVCCTRRETGRRKRRNPSSRNSRYVYQVVRTERK